MITALSLPFVILGRYIIKQTALTTLLVLGFLVLMLLGGRLIRYFGMAAQGGLQPSFLFRLVGYNLPFFLELILPLAFFVALMLTFGRLYADSEMAAMNAAGISKYRLASLLWPLVFLLFLLQCYLSLVAKPWGIRNAETIWQQQSLAQAFDLIRPQEFMSSGNYHLYVGQVGKTRQVVNDVMVIEQKPNGDSTLILARGATQVNGSDAVQLDLLEGRRYEFNPNSLGYQIIGFDSYRLGLETKELPSFITKTTTRPTDELIFIGDEAAFAELGYRLSLPFLIVFALLLALPLSKVNPRQGRWLKLLPAVLSFVVLAMSIISLKEPIAKGRVSPLGYPLLVVLIFLGLMVVAGYDELWRSVICKKVAQLREKR